MSQEEVLRLVAKARDDASPALRKIRENLAAVKEGASGPRDATRHLKVMHEEATRGAVELKKQYLELRDHLDKVTSGIREGMEPAFAGLGVKGLAATGAVAALGEAIKNFAERGNDLTAFARQARLTVETVRGMEGVAAIFNVDPAAVRQSEQALTDAMYKFRRHKGEFYAYLKAQRPEDAAALAITPETIAGDEKALQLWLSMLEKIKKEHGDAAARAFSKEALGSDTFVDMLDKGTAGLAAAIERYNAAAGKIDASKGKAFAENLAEFKDALEGLSNSAGERLLPEITKGVHDLSEAIKVYGPGFADGIVGAVHGIEGVVTDVWPKLRSAFDQIDPYVQKVGGWKPVFEGLAIIRLTTFAASVTGLATAVGAFGQALNLIPLATLVAIAKFADEHGILKVPDNLSTKDIGNAIEPGLGNMLTKDPRPEHERFQNDRRNLNPLFGGSVQKNAFVTGFGGGGGLMGAHSDFEQAIARGTAAGVVKGLSDFESMKSMDADGGGVGGGLQQAAYRTFEGGGSGGGSAGGAGGGGGGRGAAAAHSAAASLHAHVAAAHGALANFYSGGTGSTTTASGAGFTSGMRARNLGNIGYFGQHMAGLMGPSNSRDVDHSIAMFATQEDGIRAAARLALHKYQRGMRNSAALIAGRGGWTPGALGPSASVNVARAMGLSNRDDLHLDNPVMMQRFLRGLAIQEHGPRGGSYYTNEMIGGALGLPAPGATSRRASDASRPSVDVNGTGRL